jgi:branched-chain amino acid transport system substrate-binding protein
VFLNAEVGANLVFPSEKQENVFHHTLHYWQANWAAGTWAAQTLGKRAVVLATFYEAGFDALAAFQLAFEQAGGEVLRTVISHSLTEAWLPQETLSRLAALKPDFVYLMGMGEQVAELQAAFQSSPMVGRVPFLMSGFAHTEGTRSAGLADFARSYHLETGEQSEAMALLGYGTGLLIQAARQTMAQTGVSLTQALSTATFDSPRGRVSMDAEIHATTASAFVNGEGKLLADLSAVDATIARLHPGWSEIRTGWITPYFSL